MSKHSSAPWKPAVHISKKNGRTITRPAVLSANNCYITTQIGGETLDHSETVANMFLIASAPYMLTALKKQEELKIHVTTCEDCLYSEFRYCNAAEELEASAETMRRIALRMAEPEEVA